MFVVGDALRWNSRRRPGDLAVVDAGGSYTWSALTERSHALARGLLEHGVGRGGAVGVLSGNGRFAAETYLGVAASGAASVQYNWRWTAPELAQAIGATDARVVLVEEPYREALEEALALAAIEHPPLVVAQGAAYEAFLRPGPAPDAGVTPADPNVVIFTGGTTGFSKGVVLSHRNVVANALNEIIDTDMRPDDRTLVIAPMFHSGSLLCWFLPHVVLGAATVFLRSFDEDEVAATIEHQRITNGFLVPNMLRRMLASGALEGRDVSSYRRLYVGGGALRMPDKVAALDVLSSARLYYQYGLTEAGPIVTRLRPEDMLREEVDGSIGQEFLLNEVELRDAAGAPVAAGDVGEIWVRGPNVMLGYYREPEATAEVLVDGWLRTGDLAVRDEDGYLFFQDRAKDMIKTGGENVYSAEVERVLYGHPAVAEAAVVGVASDDWDEEVRAVVALRPGVAADPDALRAHCRQVLAGYKVPKRIAIVALSQMPVNQSGKVLKRELDLQGLFG